MLVELANELAALAAGPADEALLQLAPLLNRRSDRSAESRIAYARTLAARQLVDEEGGQRGAQVKVANRVGMTERALSRVVLGQPRQAR